jgi:hypothetical protein
MRKYEGQPEEEDNKFNIIIISRCFNLYGMLITPRPCETFRNKHFYFTVSSC